MHIYIQPYHLYTQTNTFIYIYKHACIHTLTNTYIHTFTLVVG